MNKQKFKPFDLESAKNGAPVITANGDTVRIVCFDVKGGEYPLLALVDSHGVERPAFYDINGAFNGWSNLYMA